MEMFLKCPIPPFAIKHRIYWLREAVKFFTTTEEEILLQNQDFGKWWEHFNNDYYENGLKHIIPTRGTHSTNEQWSLVCLHWGLRAIVQALRHPNEKAFQTYDEITHAIASLQLNMRLWNTLPTQEELDQLESQCGRLFLSQTQCVSTYDTSAFWLDASIVCTGIGWCLWFSKRWPHAPITPIAHLPSENNVWKQFVGVLVNEMHDQFDKLMDSKLTSLFVSYTESLLYQVHHDGIKESYLTLIDYFRTKEETDYIRTHKFRKKEELQEQLVNFNWNSPSTDPILDFYFMTLAGQWMSRHYDGFQWETGMVVYCNQMLEDDITTKLTCSRYPLVCHLGFQWNVYYKGQWFNTQNALRAWVQWMVLMKDHKEWPSPVPLKTGVGWEVIQSWSSQDVYPS